ncbi:MAG: LemA family protein [Verrucomicrobiota bacterium]|nr:LemA family protein [Verrucomicrobiota bacterium]
MTELKGTAEIANALTSYLQGCRCVYYRYSVEEHWRRVVQESYTDSKGNRRTRTKVESGWSQVDAGGESAPFFLQDDTGAVRIQPDGAKVEASEVFSQRSTRGDGLYYSKGPATSISDSTHERRFTEWAIPLHQPIYVIGQAREREDAVAAEIAKDAHQALFLISVRKEEQISGGLFQQQCILGILSGVLFCLYPLAIDHARPSQTVATLPIISSIAAAWLMVWVVAWSILTINALVDIKQRAAHAFTLIDIQLKRRHDLIGNLVNAVSALAQHERGLQEALVLLRHELTATPPGATGPDPVAIASQIRAIKEDYPTLTANQAFLQLTTTLSDTEQRIALARNYYNDVVEVHNTRIQVIPDSILARLLSMKPRVLFEANGFEREAVSVSFTAAS